MTYDPRPASPVSVPRVEVADAPRIASGTLAPATPSALFAYFLLRSNELRAGAAPAYRPGKGQT